MFPRAHTHTIYASTHTHTVYIYIIIYIYTHIMYMMYICARTHARIVTECYRYLWLSFQVCAAISSFPNRPSACLSASGWIGKSRSCPKCSWAVWSRFWKARPTQKTQHAPLLTWRGQWSPWSWWSPGSCEAWCKAAACSQEDVWKTLKNDEQLGKWGRSAKLRAWGCPK